MAPLTNNLHDFAANVYIAALGSIASIAAFFWFIYDKFSPAPEDIFELVILLIVVLFFIGLGYYSIRVRQENSAFRRSVGTIHKINHDYRDILSKMFGGEEPITDERVKIQNERDTLQAVCQALAKMYNSFTHVDCMVTVKLITKDNHGRLSCGTYVRSEINCERDRFHPGTFVINAGENTAFDEALRFSRGRVSHFFSPDLAKIAKEGGYRNQRYNWERFYNSAIVVPIRYINPAKADTPDASDDIGFLCVDTKSAYRLNDGYHLQYLAAFADQMYNFMSLMRGRYRISESHVPAPRRIKGLAFEVDKT
jgi:hypothetical protein